MHKKIKKILTFFFSAYLVVQSAGFLFLEPPMVSAASDMPKLTIPDLQIKIPGLAAFSQPADACVDEEKYMKCSINWLSEYISGIYKYGIGIVGILATVVMMFGGFLYLTAAGDKSRIGEAKEWIKASLTGLVIAMSSYMILYQVNPELINLKPLKITVIGKAPTGEDTCKLYNTEAVINFNTAETKSLPMNCNSTLISGAAEGAASKYGLDKKLLMAIAATESGCIPNATSKAGACGITQLMPTTAQQYNKNATCDWLNNLNNMDAIFEISAQYIKSSGYSLDDKEKIFAGYNGGYGTGTNSAGKKGPLAPSSDCPGSLAYQCCKNVGELAETQAYVLKTTKYYNGQ